MAKIKADIAPANQQVNNGDAIDRWIGQVDQNIDEIRRTSDDAYRAGQSRGFDEQLASSKALNITYDVLALWFPKTARVEGDAAEDKIRDVHHKAEPQSSSLALKQAKSWLGMLANACEPATVEHVRVDLGRRIMPARDGDKSPADGVKALQAKRADAVQAKDKGLVSILDRHIAAIGDVDKVVDLCRVAQLIEKGNSRFRQRFYLHLVHPLMVAGKVPNAEYETVCGKAYEAHRLLNKLSTQEHTAKRVQAAIETAVGTWIAETYGTKAKDVRSNAEVGMAAALAVITNARKAAKMGAIPENVRDVILAYMTASQDKGGAGIVDPEDAKADAAAQRIADRKAKKDAAKAAATKAAKPSTTKAKAKKEVKLPSATPRKARVSPAAPPSTVVATTADEGVLADLAG